MASPLKRVSESVESSITAIADREDRTFVAQLDRVVAAGLAALGEPVPTAIAGEPVGAASGSSTPKRTRARAGK